MASELEAVQQNTEVLTAFTRVPYSLITREIDGSAKDTLAELTQICGFYKVYKKGASFFSEGTNGDYVPANLHYRMAASLINKEARFLFAAPPDITVGPKSDPGKVGKETKNALTILNDLVKTVLDENNFEEQLVKAAKDCFIGKRVCCLVNFNEVDGIVITFLPATQFIYETQIGNSNVLKKLVCFDIIKDSVSTCDKRIFMKKFTSEDSGIYVEEALYDGAGALIEDVTPRAKLELDVIPAAIFINDGLTGEHKGESEIELLTGYEQWYSKLSNADIDAERKSMNPVKYTIDMDSGSTKDLSTAAGAYWDLVSDQNLDNPHPSTGQLEPGMNYSNALKVSLDRIKTTGYEQIDMPNITLETMQGSITSGKALKAIYWPLIVRCKEKMKMWGPQLANVVDVIIKGSMVYPDCAKKYISEPIIPVMYEIEVKENTPLPEDEVEEKTMDISEVESNLMSKKAYMKKWRNLTDDEAQQELEQIAMERQLIEEASFNLENDVNEVNKLYYEGRKDSLGVTSGSQEDIQKDIDEEIIEDNEEEAKEDELTR